MVIYVGFGGIWPSAASADVCGVCGWQNVGGYPWRADERDGGRRGGGRRGGCACRRARRSEAVHAVAALLVGEGAAMVHSIVLSFNVILYRFTGGEKII